MEDMKIVINLATLKELKQILDFVKPHIPEMSQIGDVAWAYENVTSRLRGLQVQAECLHKIMSPIEEEEVIHA